MENNKGLAFGKKNYMILGVGVLIIAGGLIVMSTETAKYGFGVRGLTIGPIMIVVGFIVNFFAIFAKTKEEVKDSKGN